MNPAARIAIVICVLLMVGCSDYQYKAIPFKAPGADSPYVTVSGANISARVWTDGNTARRDFGLDVIGAGLTPVQVVVDNQGDKTLVLIPKQTLLKDAEGNYWNLLPAGEAYERLDRNTTPGRVAGSSAQGGILGGAAGAIIGAAVGIVSGQSVGESAGKGAVIGATGGVIVGGHEAMTDREAREKIVRDMEERSLEDKPFAPAEISHGFLFFPGEAKTPALLRLKLKDVDGKTEHIVDLTLQWVR